VAPRYWQDPATLKDVYVSTSGGAVGGSQATNAVAGTSQPQGREFGEHANAQAARNLATNSIGATAKGGLDRLGGLDQPGDDGSARAVAHYPGRDPARRQPSGLLVANTISFNLPPTCR